MCQIIFNPDNATIPIPRSLIENAWRSNNCGWGIMKVVKNSGVISVDHGMELPELLAKMDEYDDMDGVMVVHLRAGSNAVIENCHPFKVTDKVWLAHNGYFSHVKITKPQRSDTWHYAKYYLKWQLIGREELLDMPDFVDAIADDVGSNRVVLLRNDGKTFIINEDHGEHWKGLWLANQCGIPGGGAVRRYKGFTTTDMCSLPAWDDIKDDLDAVDNHVEEKKTPLPDVFQGNLSGDPLLSAYLIKTPEYFKLDKNRALLFLNMNLKAANGIRFNKQEIDFWLKCRTQVKKNLEEANIMSGKAVEWCKGLIKLFLMERTDEERLKILDLEPYFSCPVPDVPPAKLPKKTKCLLVDDNNGYLHQCTTCKKLCKSKDMWFTDAQQKEPIDGREGTCQKCYDDEQPKPVVITNKTVNPIKTSSYSGGGHSWVNNHYQKQEVLWHCIICNGDGYTLGGWATGDKEKPVCYTCNNKIKREQEHAEIVKNAGICGIDDASIMTEFEIDYWKNKTFMKDVIKIEVATNAVG